MIPVIAFVYGVVVSVVGALGSLFLKLGAKNFSLRRPFNVRLFIGIFLYVVSTIFFILGLRVSPLSFFYPFTGLLYVFSFLLGVVILKERFSKIRLFGVFIILLGIILVSLR